MFKTFTAGLFGIIFSTTLGVFVATSSVNATVSIDASASTVVAQYMD